MAFLEVSLSQTGRYTSPLWQDASDSDYYKFCSARGVVSLRRRNEYPATFAKIEGPNLIIGYGEIDDAHAVAKQPLDSVSEDSLFGKDFLYIAINGQTGAVCVQRDAMVTLPLFAGHSGSKLVICNDFARTCQHLSGSRLSVNPYALVDQVLVLPVWGDYTLFREVVRVQERERLLWDGAHLRREYASDGSVVLLGSQRDSDPYAAKRSLERVLDDYWQRYGAGNIGTELSGGLDSAVAAAYFASTGRSAPAYTIVYPGSYRQSQLHKINAFCDIFKITDWTTAIEPSRDYPLSRFVQRGRWEPMFHDQEVYEEAFSRICQKAASDGVSVMFKGTGGDELSDSSDAAKTPFAAGDYAVDLLQNADGLPFAGSKFEMYIDTAKQIARSCALKPAPLISPSVMSAHESSNNIYIEHGIWPVAPLGDPRLYRYFQSLPVRFRANRNLIRAYLQARHAPESIYDAKFNESFRRFTVKAMPYTLAAAEKLLARSVLQHNGVVDVAGLVRLTEQDVPKTVRHAALFRAYKVIIAEATLQSLGYDRL